MAISGGGLLFAEDIERIQRKLSALPNVMANKIMRRALRDGAKIALAEYENNLTRMQDTGAMLASTRIAPLKRNRRGRLNVGVQIVTDATTHDRPEVKHYGQDFPYPFMVEFGHRIGRRSDAIKALHRKRSAIKTGKSAGSMEEIEKMIQRADKRQEVHGKYPMRRAFDSTKDIVRGAIHNSINQAVRNISQLTARGG